MSSAQTDTIVALATPPGRSGIGMVRLSGAQALDILRTLVNSRSFNPPPNALTLRSIFDPVTGELIDQAMVCYFTSPHSFTGEDVVEINAHGSPILLRSIIDACLHLSARMADPGEFSLRAVANGRMNLSEAEAIRDLINAQSEAAVRQARRQMKGELSNALQPLKDELLRIIVRLESDLEFVEDDLTPATQHEITVALNSLENQCSELAKTFRRGHLLRDGLKVALVGRPNVGKSSLFNCLVGRARAIVTEIPGTTRDTITEVVSIDGVPVALTDTAGLREAADRIEVMGVDRTRREAADSDLLVLVIDGCNPPTDEDRLILHELADARFVVATNKSDASAFASSNTEVLLQDMPSLSSVIVSAKTGHGMKDLRTAIIEPFTAGGVNGQGLLITNARHYDLLLRTLDGIRSSQEAIQVGASEELVVVGLHSALRFLGQITGETTSDEILGQIFSTFCIGK